MTIGHPNARRLLQKSRKPSTSPTYMTEALRYCWKTLASSWKRCQVESNGAYSVERLNYLRDYSERVTTTHCVLVVVLTSLPPLLLCVLLESIPLRSPVEGIKYSFLLWVRTSVITSVVIFCFMWPCRFFIPRLPWSTLSTLMAATGAGVISTVGTFGLAYVVGFPLPFTLVCESAIGTVFMCIGMVVIWGSFLASNRGGRIAFIHHFTLVALEVSMTWVYPAYAYVFNQLSGVQQIAAMALLPVIRLFYKNTFAHMVRNYPDLTSCAVVFSADLYHVLFMSWCMNGTTSKKAIVSLMLVNVLEASLALYEINMAVAHITASVSKKISFLKTVLGYLRSHSSFTHERTDSLLTRTKTAMGLFPPSSELPRATTAARQGPQMRTNLNLGLTCTAAISCRRVKESRVVPSDADPNDIPATQSTQVATENNARGLPA